MKSTSPRGEGERIVVVSIATETRGGHFIPFHTAVGRIARSLGWRHVCAVDETSSNDIPGDWLRCLKHSHDLETPGVQDLVRNRALGTLLSAMARAVGRAWELGRTMRDVLLGAARPDERVVVFIEWFNPFHLLALWFGIARARLRGKGRFRPSCWIMFHYIFDPPRLHMVANRLTMRLIEFTIGRGNLKILAEWEPAASQYAAYFRRSVTMMPLTCSWPGKEVKGRDRERGVISCWWPGIPHPRKGSEAIREIALRTDARAAEEPPIEIHVPRSLEAQSPAGGPSLVVHEDRMETADYVAQMESTDVVLLPYDLVPYANVSSGIFMEAVMAGRMPLVTPSTTMASELRRYGLDRLIADWTAPGFWRNVRELLADEELHGKLVHMRADYLIRFSDDNFAEHMRGLVRRQR